MYWCNSSGHIELNITRRQAEACAHPGQCDSDVVALSQAPKIRRQLDRIKPDILRDDLRDYGAWSEAELADHAQNLQRILWIACNDIAEGR